MSLLPGLRTASRCPNLPSRGASSLLRLPPKPHRFTHQPKRSIFGIGGPVTYGSLLLSKWLVGGVIAANIGIFGLWQVCSQPRAFGLNETQGKQGMQVMSQNFVLHPDDNKRGRWWTPLTSAFSHTAPWHLMGNMVSLHAFTTVLIQAGVPAAALAALMFGSALGGSVAWLLNEPTQGRRREALWGVPVLSGALGASGMVMGLGAAATMLRPASPFLLMGVVPMPLWALFLGYTAFDTYYRGDASSRIGHSAHLGGSACGATFYALFLRSLGGILGRL